MPGDGSFRGQHRLPQHGGRSWRRLVPKAIFSKVIEFTDFPLPEIALYFANKTILLPSEY